MSIVCESVRAKNWKAHFMRCSTASKHGDFVIGSCGQRYRRRYGQRHRWRYRWPYGQWYRWRYGHMYRRSYIQRYRQRYRWRYRRSYEQKYGEWYRWRYGHRYRRRYIQRCRQRYNRSTDRGTAGVQTEIQTRRFWDHLMQICTRQNRFDGRLPNIMLAQRHLAFN